MIPSLNSFNGLLAKLDLINPHPFYQDLARVSLKGRVLGQMSNAFGLVFRRYRQFHRQERMLLGHGGFGAVDDIVDELGGVR